MTKYLMLLAVAMLMMACGGDDGNDSVDKDPVDDNAQPDADTPPVWVTDQTYAGLEWSSLSESTMTWQQAMDYCAAMNTRLPNINELRKIIINCPGSTYGGACPVSDPDCLDSICGDENCGCVSTADSYSALGDGKDIMLWSSSSHAYNTSYAWGVDFGYGSVGYSVKVSSVNARCVR